MQKQMQKLTEYEQTVLLKLKERGQIYWSGMTSDQTKALNRMVSKGFATFDTDTRAWRLAKT